MEKRLFQDRPPRRGNFQIWMPLLFAIVLVGGMLIGMQIRGNAPVTMVESAPKDEGVALGNGKIEEILRYIEAKYVDDVNRDELMKMAIEEILQNLDPHSNYIPAEQLREVNEQLEGNFDGIGVEFMIIEDTIVVITPLAGGPSEAVGIKSVDENLVLLKYQKPEWTSEKQSRRTFLAQDYRVIMLFGDDLGD